MNWKEIFHSFVSSEVMSDNLMLGKILSDYKIVFSDEVGTLKDFQPEIPVDPQVKPIYIRALPVPQEKTEHELDRLVNLGIYQPAASSKWAAPIVIGDYKQTVNKAANCDKYPIPKTEDIFVTLHGGEKFSKLDLSKAYQQLILSQARGSSLQ